MRNYFSSVADRDRIEAESTYEERDLPHSIYEMLSRTKERFPDAPALSFQLFSDPDASARTLSWRELHERVTETANLFRDLGIGPDDTVAFLLPNSIETPVIMLAAATAGIVNPINPLLEPDQIAALLRESGAKVLVALRAFPKSDIAEKAAEALRLAPDVKTLIEVDLTSYLPFVKRLAVAVLRPRVRTRHHAKILDFASETASRNHDRLNFEESREDRVAAYFHTGGTTGMPKLAQHKLSGMVYNGWLGAELMFDSNSVVLCPLPMFHVFAAYPILMSCLASGAHLVMPTPAGYRGDGVFDNFWKLIERWQASFLITVPTAVSALLQRKINADVSSLKIVLSGSAPLPLELYKRFEAKTNVGITEGYGLTEATCLVSCNPIDGLKKVGSVGIPLPYTKIRIIRSENGNLVDCATNEIGEICISSPGIFDGATYTDPDKNRDLFVDGSYLRTGDLGRLDEDGYLWITGRAKDLIIRGGHNIDPAVIEDALLSHPEVAFAGAIGQPDIFAGELPCAYIELVAGAQTTTAELEAHLRDHITERAAIPKHIEIMAELPKTAVGKVFKPDLRAMATKRVYNQDLAKLNAHVVTVRPDAKLGLVAVIERVPGSDDAAIEKLMDSYAARWEWSK